MSLVRFSRTEYQDMLGETVDEAEPISVKTYWGNARVFNAYNSKYLRGGIARSQVVYVNGWYMMFKESLGQLGKIAKRSAESALRRFRPAKNADETVHPSPAVFAGEPAKPSNLGTALQSASTVAVDDGKTLKSGVGSTLLTPPDEQAALPF